jgi:23S rRNA (cytidine1920-2'-O)/16S rRNA (cytidine1409-2'-O)-methyltransferase
MRKSMKKRLDQIVQEKLPQLSRNQISSFIVQGKVKVDGKIITKPGTQIKDDAKIETDTSAPKFVSRAGFKLEGALDHFNIDVSDLVALDAGISTGGFSDCLLQRGIKKVYGIDVGYGQVHEKVANNPKVVVLERTNLRELKNLSEKVDIATLDLSFISVLKVMPTVSDLLKDSAQIVLLIKPQFESEKGQVGKGGIVRDEKVHEQVKEKVVSGLKEYGFICKGIIDSPITGSSGNKEFLGYFVR